MLRLYTPGSSIVFERDLLKEIENDAGKRLMGDEKVLTNYNRPLKRC